MTTVISHFFFWFRNGPTRAHGLLLYLLLIATISSAMAKQFSVAYVTTTSGATTSNRVDELRKSLDSIAKSEFKEIVSFEIKTHHFDLRERNEIALPEAAALNEKMSETVLSSKPDVIYAAGAAAAKFFAAKTSSIPIVIGCKCNPGPTSKRWNIIANLCAPERNITGFTRYDLRVIAPTSTSENCNTSRPNELQLDNLIPARAQALRDARDPPLSRIGFVGADLYDETKWKFIARLKALGIDLIPITISVGQIDELKSIYAQFKLDAAIINSDSLLDGNTRRYINATAAIPIPTMFPWDEADNGAWMHLGTKVDLAQEAARYIIAIAKGTPIRLLPVSFPTEYELVVNHKLAKSHGWVFPKKFLLLPQREPATN